MVRSARSCRGRAQHRATCRSASAAPSAAASPMPTRRPSGASSRSTLDAEIVARSARGRADRCWRQDFFRIDLHDRRCGRRDGRRGPAAVARPSWRCGFTEFSRRAGRLRDRHGGGRVRVEGGRIAEARIALGGVGDRPVRIAAAEQALCRASRPRGLCRGRAHAARGRGPVRGHPRLRRVPARAGARS